MYKDQKKLILYAKTRNARIILPPNGPNALFATCYQNVDIADILIFKNVPLADAIWKRKTVCLCTFYKLFFHRKLNDGIISVHTSYGRTSKRLCTYVHTPLGRTSIHPLNVRPHTLGRTSIEKLWDKMGKHDPKSPFSRLLRIAYLPTRKFPVDFTAFSEAIEKAKSYGLLPMRVNMSQACSPTLLLNMS